jgi:hypothetical protein
VKAFLLRKRQTNALIQIDSRPNSQFRRSSGTGPGRWFRTGDEFSLKKLAAIKTPPAPPSPIPSSLLIENSRCQSQWMTPGQTTFPEQQQLET